MAKHDKAKILVADDEQGIRDLLTFELGGQGFSITTVSNGEDAVEKVRAEKFNLVISDIKMPKMDGLEALEAIKKIDPDVEVIIVTGYGTIESAVSAMKHGAYDYIQKPFNLDEMMTLVDRALEKADLKALVTLYEASQSVYSSVKIESLLSVVVAHVMKLLKADTVSILLKGADGKLSIAASHGLEESVARSVHLEMGERIAGKVARDREAALIVGPLEDEPRFAGIESRKEIRSSIVCPLFSKDEVLGILCASRTGNEIPFSRMEERYAGIFASQVAQALDNARLYRELEDKVQELSQAYQELSRAQSELVQSEKLAAIGELASGVAHELNNPLTAVIGLCDLMLEVREDTATTQADLTTIREQADRCRKIIVNLLQFSRKHQMERKPIQANEAVEKVFELVEYELKSSGLQIEKYFQPDLPKVTADFYQLQQVFLNLINNARHALKGREGGMLTVRSKAADGKVVFSFEDNGCGIPANLLNKIFDPFFTTKEVGQGTGLGLSISYGIIKEHGGTITVQSKEGKGSTFTIHLPIAS